MGQVIQIAYLSVCYSCEEFSTSVHGEIIFRNGTRSCGFMSMPLALEEVERAQVLRKVTAAEADYLRQKISRSPFLSGPMLAYIQSSLGVQ